MIMDSGTIYHEENKKVSCLSSMTFTSLANIHTITEIVTRLVANFTARLESTELVVTIIVLFTKPRPTMAIRRILAISSVSPGGFTQAQKVMT